MNHEKEIKYISTFSGIGGFELGIERALGSKCDYCGGADPAPCDPNNRELEHSNSYRLQRGAQRRGDSDAHTHGRRGTRAKSSTRRDRRAVCVGFSEVDKYATQIYRRHFPDHPELGDITKIKTADLPDFDLLVGGFPCQAFSIAGRRMGFADTRGTLFFQLARILADKQPRLFLFENVKGLLSHDEGRTFRTIISTIDELGYDAQWQVLNSKDFGVPQNRERIFIVGNLRGTPRPEVFPFCEADRTAHARYFAGDPEVEIAQTIRSRYGNGSGSHIETGTIRRLTPIECERLQGFPDGWTALGRVPSPPESNGYSTQLAPISDAQRYKTLGNAVTVNVIGEIMCRMLV